MAIRLRLATVMGEKHIRTITQLSQLSGLSRSTLTPLWYERVKRLDFDTLNGLCKALNCQPGDLLVYVPDRDA